MLPKLQQLLKPDVAMGAAKASWSCSGWVPSDGSRSTQSSDLFIMLGRLELADFMKGSELKFTMKTLAPHEGNLDSQSCFIVWWAPPWVPQVHDCSHLSPTRTSRASENCNGCRLNEWLNGWLTVNCTSSFLVIYTWPISFASLCRILFFCHLSAFLNLWYPFRMTCNCEDPLRALHSCPCCLKGSQESKAQSTKNRFCEFLNSSPKP